MRLFFNNGYKSIQTLPIEELPQLTIITGENGVGKTHFLDAIRENAISVDNIPVSTMGYYTWGNMVPAYEQNVVPRSISTPNYAKKFSLLSEGVSKDILAEISLRIKASPNVPTFDISIKKEHLLSCLSNGNLYTNLPNYIQEIVTDSISMYRNCLIGQLIGVQMHQNLQVSYHDADVQREYGIRYTDRRISRSHVLDFDECRLLLKIIEKKKDFFNLSETDCLELYPLTLEIIDPFLGSLSKLFAAYVNAKEINDLNEIRYKRDEAEGFLANEEFLDRFGPAPWDILNEVLQYSLIPFRFKRPNLNAGEILEILLVNTDSGAEIMLAELSSGERIILSFAQFIFLSDYSRQLLSMPQLILLDEVDAPLHPSMTASMLRVIVDVLVQKYGRRVIMVTHSPSTVALAPEEALFVMDRVPKHLRKVSRDEAIHTLTAGVPVLSIKLENRRQVFVESNYDVLYYERLVDLLKKHLDPEISFVFIAGGNCDKVRTLVKELVDGGSHVVFGIVDWDKKAVSTEKVRVLGSGQRYSIENYLLDPILLAVLLYRLRLVGRDVLMLGEGQTFADLRSFSNEQLQQVVDNTLAYLKLSGQPGEITRTCSYIGGYSVQIPISYLERQGHDLESIIKGHSDKFRRFNNEGALKLEILNEILYEMPGFISTDFVSLLVGIQAS